MKNLFLLLSVFIALPALSADSFVVDENKLRDAFAYHLKDSDSAKFRNIRTKKDKEYKNIHVICGDVNAKNQYGAYDGFVPFRAGRRGADEKGTEEYVVVGTGLVMQELCSRDGL
jgi:hypothetical protein